MNQAQYQECQNSDHCWTSVCTHTKHNQETGEWRRCVLKIWLLSLAVDATWSACPWSEYGMYVWESQCDETSNNCLIFMKRILGMKWISCVNMLLFIFVTTRMSSFSCSIWFQASVSGPCVCICDSDPLITIRPCRQYADGDHVGVGRHGDGHAAWGTFLDGHGSLLVCWNICKLQDRSMAHWPTRASYRWQVSVWIRMCCMGSEACLLVISRSVLNVCQSLQVSVIDPVILTM